MPSPKMLTPAIIVRREPNLAAIRGAMVDVGIIIAAIGSSPAADRSADQPTTAWR